MARPRRRLTAFLALALAVAPGIGGAAAMRTLHVVALGMHADRTHVRIGEPFHVAIHVRVTENVAALDELVIPDVGTLQIVGDERRTMHGPAGTDVVETVTLQAAGSGRYTLSPAYLDAIDARTGRPSRFSSNPLSVVVAGPAAALRSNPLSAALGVLLWLAIAFAIFIAAFVLLARRRPRVAAAAAVAPPVVHAPPAPPRTPRDDVADALRTYRVSPSPVALARLRTALFAAAGARDGATLGDALAATSDARLRSALSAAERTAFGPERERDAASSELVGVTEAWL